jgi:hypothetical protein
MVSHRRTAQRTSGSAQVVEPTRPKLLIREGITQLYIDDSLLHVHMTKVEKLEREIAELAPGDLAIFRKWFAAFDAKAWDRQLEADADAGKLDAVAESALREYRAGKTRPL